MLSSVFPSMMTKRRNEARVAHMNSAIRSYIASHKVRCQHIIMWDDSLEDKIDSWGWCDKKQLLSTMTFVGEDECAA